MTLSSQGKSLFFFIKNDDSSEEYNIFSETNEFEIRGMEPNVSSTTFGVLMHSQTAGILSVSFQDEKLFIANRTKVFQDNIEINSFTPEKTELQVLNRSNQLPITESSGNIFQDSLVKIKRGMTPDVETFKGALIKMDLNVASEAYFALINSIIDDKSDNIDFLGKRTVNSELVIIDYIQDKLRLFEELNRFLFKTEFFASSKQSYQVYLNAYEKLKIARILRSKENEIINKGTNRADSAHNDIRNYIFTNALESVMYTVPENHRNYAIKWIYSQTNNILGYFKTMIGVLKTYLSTLSRDKPYLEITIEFVYLCSSIISELETLHKVESDKMGFDVSLISSLADENFLKDSIFVLRQALDVAYETKTAQDNFEIVLFRLAEKILYLNSTIERREGQEYELFSAKRKQETIEKLHSLNLEAAFELALSFGDYHHILLLGYKLERFDQITAELRRNNINPEHLTYLIRLSIYIEKSLYDSKKLQQIRLFGIFHQFGERFSEVLAHNQSLLSAYQVYKNGLTDESETLLDLNSRTELNRDVHVKFRDTLQTFHNLRNEYVQEGWYGKLNLEKTLLKANLDYSSLEAFSNSVVSEAQLSVSDVSQLLRKYLGIFNVILGAQKYIFGLNSCDELSYNILENALIPTDCQVIVDSFNEVSPNGKWEDDIGDQHMRELAEKSVLNYMNKTGDELEELIGRLIDRYKETNKENMDPTIEKYLKIIGV